MEFLPINELTFGFSDAENYRRRENKELFNKIFLRTDALDKIKKQNTYFLVGEKGTGKTAYAVYLSNSPSDELLAVHKFIRETDYLKFISLKKEHNLSLSEYTDIWKVIILLIVSREIYDKLGILQQIVQYPKFKAINKAIDEYYQTAFSPEILNALQFVENSSIAAELVSKSEVLEAGLKAEESVQTTRNLHVFQTSLLYLQRKMEDAIRSLKLPKDFYIFIDGIDIRPNSVPYSEYLDCVKGLANAVWSLNNDFFANIKDSKGRVKSVLLLRHDIFNSLGLQNRNTKLKDNSVVLNWITDYGKHRNSELFYLADRIFSSQQASPSAIGQCWDHYFPFEAQSLDYNRTEPTSFVVFLRYSYHRPRDILTMLDIVGEQHKVSGKKSVFTYEDVSTSYFKETYGNYLLGEIRDSLSFYYDEREFELFLKFFEFLDGKRRFSFDEYEFSFEQFQKHIEGSGQKTPDFMRSSEEFLQFLYDQNVLCFIEQTMDESFIRWCFRERNANNASPKVKVGLTYEIHYGLANTLNTGKILKSKNTRKRQENKNEPKQPAKEDKLLGTIKIINKKKGFGFIKSPTIPFDVYFKTNEKDGTTEFGQNDNVSFRLIPDPKKKGQYMASDIKRKNE